MHRQIITPPTIEPVSLQDVKDHAHIQHSRDDMRLLSLMHAARRAVESFADIQLLTQTIRLTYSDTPDANLIKLPIAPVQSMTVKYMDTAETEQTFSSSSYGFTRGGNGVPSRLYLLPSANWPVVWSAEEAFWVDAVCGETSPDQLPEDLRLSILMAVTYWHQNRAGKEQVAGKGKFDPEAQQLRLPPEVETILSPYKLVWI